MSNFIECQQELLSLANSKGYLTLDDILDIASTALLSTSEVDRLSENLQVLGVLLYESAPEQCNDESDAFSDYSRTDFDAVFAELISLSESLAPLIDIVKEIPPLQFREVQNLVEQLQYGNIYAKERLILSHLRVVLRIALSVAKQYSYDIEDVVSSGMIGLTTALEHFDPNGFSSFQSYASIWIQQSIHRYCEPKWMQYYYPAHIKERLYPVLLKYNENNGTIVNDNDFDFGMVCILADEFAFEPNQLLNHFSQVYNQLYGRLDVDAILCCDYFEEQLVDPDCLLNDDEELLNGVSRKILVQLTDELLETLTPREREILELRFGFDGTPRTLEEIGKKFDITKERVRQIESKGIRKLRHPSRAKLIRDFYI